MDLHRIFRHLLLPHWIVARTFPQPVLRAIERAITESETRHDAELCFAVEVGLSLPTLLRGVTARQRAIEVFSQLRVWDTEHNSGVLIYVQLVDRKVEIIADRGINALVLQSDWDAVCRRLEQSYRQGRFEQGSLAAIAELSEYLARHFPAHVDKANELSNRPAIL